MVLLVLPVVLSLKTVELYILSSFIDVTQRGLSSMSYFFMAGSGSLPLRCTGGRYLT